MIQFNQQYIRDYLKPFLQEVLTDMSTTIDKGDPLYKIKNQIQISAEDKQQFEKKYFLGQQPANRPFTGQDEGEYRKYFLEELANHATRLIRLSNVKGMQEALLPDAEVGRTFGNHQVLTRNLNRLSLTLARNFEKRKIKEKLSEEGSLTEEKQHRIENGEMKLLEIDGKEEVKTEEEMTAMARKEPQKLIVPMIEPTLEKTSNVPKKSSDGKEKVQKETLQSPKKKSVTIAEVKQDFDAAKIESIRKTLSSSGLEVVGELKIEGGVVSGTVRDVEGQELKVSVDSKKPNYAADKFVFIFTAHGPHPELEGSRIPVSQNDLHSIFFEEEGKRKPAEKVFKEQDAYGTMAKGKYTPPPKSSLAPKMPATKLPQQQGKGAEMQQSPEVQRTVIIKPQVLKTIEGGKAPVGIGIMAGVQPVRQPMKTFSKKEEIKKSVAGAHIKGPQLVSKRTTMEKKREVAKQRQAALEARQQQRGQRKTQPGVQQKVPVQQPQQKKGMPGLAKLALGTGTGGFGGTIAAAYWAATAESEISNLAVKVILSCLGIDCLA